MIDLGANVGEVSEYFLAKGATVHAYEPNPYAYNLLEKRLGKKHNIVLHKSAVSNFDGRSMLWLHHRHDENEVMFSQAASLKSEKENVSEDAVEVMVENIDNVLAAHDKIKLIKIDIEGGEYDIMDSVIASADKIDYVLLETHEKKNKAFQEKNDLLMQKIDHAGLRDKIYLDW